MLRIEEGSIDITVAIRLQDALTGAPKTGLTIGNLQASSIRIEGDNDVSIGSWTTLTALSSLNDAHSDNYAYEIGEGYYRIDLPDSIFAAGAVSGVVLIKDNVDNSILVARKEIEVTPVNTHTWHVAKTGNDNNPGHSFANAKLTIGSAVNAASDGDTILIYPGTYAESVDLDAADLYGVTLKGFSRANTIIAPASGDGVTLEDGCVLDDLYIVPDASATNAVTALDKSDIVILNCKIYGGYGGISFQKTASGTKYCLIENCVVSATRNAMYLDGAQHLVVRNSHIYTTGEVGTSIGCRAVLASEGFGVFENCVFSGLRSNASSGELGGVSIEHEYARFAFNNCVYNVESSGSHTGEVYAVKVEDFDGDGKHAMVTLANCAIHTAAANDNDEYHLYAKTGRIIAGNCYYNTAKTYGVIEAGAIGGPAVEKAAKSIVNKAVQDKVTGAINYYDDDGTTVILTHTPTDGESSITRAPS